MDVIARFECFYQHLGQGDLDGLGQLYDGDVVFIDPVSEHTGLAALKTYFLNLMKSCNACMFDMEIHKINQASVFVTWVMRFEHPQLNGGKSITVDGVSKLKIAGDKIIEQRDYYDMGAMIYENVPLLGVVVSGLRKRMVP